MSINSDKTIVNLSGVSVNLSAASVTVLTMIQVFSHHMNKRDRQQKTGNRQITPANQQWVRTKG